MTKIIKPTNHNLAIMVARDNERIASILNYKKDMFGNEFMKEDNILMLLNPEAHYEVTNYFYQYLQGWATGNGFPWFLFSETYFLFISEEQFFWK